MLRACGILCMQKRLDMACLYIYHHIVMEKKKDKIITKGTAARILGLSDQTVRNMAIKGTLPVALTLDTGERLYSLAEVEKLAAMRAKAEK